MPSSTVEDGTHNQKAAEDVAFILELTYTLPVADQKCEKNRAQPNMQASIVIMLDAKKKII